MGAVRNLKHLDKLEFIEMFVTEHYNGTTTIAQVGNELPGGAYRPINWNLIDWEKSPAAGMLPGR